MYVQASEYFPGLVLDVENQQIHFDTARFEEELTEYSQKMSDPRTFALSHAYSTVYHRFLSRDLSRYAAIRGQVIGRSASASKLPTRIIDP